MNIEKVNLITGLIYNEKADLEKIKKTLIRRYGDIDHESGEMLFDNTEYYYKEMGRPLYRKFLSFRKLVHPGSIAEIKRTTCLIEKQFKDDRGRTVNIDPGYLEPGKLVLASTKNFFHRIYLDHGIYAEVTLYWKGSRYCHFEWTFPDYRTERYKEKFTKIRGIYMSKRNELKK